MRWCFAVFALLALAMPAAAQSTYVGASLVGDIARFSKVDVDDDVARVATSLSSMDGEALGFNVKIGRSLGERWGVEFEFARSGEIEHRQWEFATPASPRLPTLPGLPVVLPPIPDFGFELEAEQQHTSFATLLWVRQELGDRVELAYLGGLAFSRVEVDQDLQITDDRLAQWALSILPNYTTVDHGVGPAVGLEAEIKFGDHAAATAGVRLHGTNVAGRNGWLIRPLAGLRWRF